MIKLNLKEEKELESLIDPWVQSINSFGNSIEKANSDKFSVIGLNGNEYQNIDNKVINVLKDETIIKNIINAEVNELNNAEENFKELYKFSTEDKKNRELLQKIFDYERFREDSRPFIWSYDEKEKKIKHNKTKKGNIDFWCASVLFERINIKACPYCNLHFLTHCTINLENNNNTEETEKKKESENIGKSERTAITVDNNTKNVKIDCCIDHYYPKESFPFLSISINNLIPSCEICNSRIKRENILSIEKYLHPFIDDFHENLRFFVKDIDPTKLLKFEERKKLFEKRLNPIINNDNKTSNNSNNFEIDVEPNNGKTDSDKNYIRAKKTCEFFYLKERISQEHSDYIAETIFKLIEYSKEYQEKICEDYQIDKEVFYRIIFGNYLEKTNINKRPLSKLSIDLKKQFEIFLIE